MCPPDALGSTSSPPSPDSGQTSSLAQHALGATVHKPRRAGEGHGGGHGAKQVRGQPGPGPATSGGPQLTSDPWCPQHSTGTALPLPGYQDGAAQGRHAGGHPALTTGLGAQVHPPPRARLWALQGVLPRFPRHCDPQTVVLSNCRTAF